MTPAKRARRKGWGTPFLAGFAVLMAAARTWSGPAVSPIVVDPSRSKLWIEGDSTLHRFSARALSFAARFSSKDAAAKSLADLILNGKAGGLELSVPVAKLSSGEKGLDKNMRAALKEKEAPAIVFRMSRYTTGDVVRGPGPSHPGQFPIRAHGTLSIAGKEREVDVDATCTAGLDGARLSGSYRLLMSDYGVTPPTFMLGALKVKDPIVVRYDFILKPGG